MIKSKLDSNLQNQVLLHLALPKTCLRYKTILRNSNKLTRSRLNWILGRITDLQYHHLSNLLFKAIKITSLNKLNLLQCSNPQQHKPTHHLHNFRHRLNFSLRPLISPQTFNRLLPLLHQHLPHSNQLFSQNSPHNNLLFSQHLPHSNLLFSQHLPLSNLLFNQLMLLSNLRFSQHLPLSNLLFSQLISSSQVLYHSNNITN